MTPSIAKNLFFRGFPTWLIDLSMDFVWECALCCNSTVNIYRCGTVTQLQYGWYCVEQFKGYLLLHNVLQKLWVLMVVLLCSLKLVQHVFFIGQAIENTYKQVAAIDRWTNA